MRVLVVDDSLTFRKVLTRMLGELGWAVSEAEDGAKGLAQLEASGPFDLALVDWHMGAMNGLEFVRRVRATPAWKATRLVVVSIETEPAKILAALTAGADEYVMKPFTRDMLVDKLALLGLAEAGP